MSGFILEPETWRFKWIKWA